MMNSTSYKAFLFGVIATLLIAALAVNWSAAAPAQRQQQQIVKLERVVIVGKRASADTQVVRLPRVVIEGRSIGAEARLLAAGARCEPEKQC